MRSTRIEKFFVAGQKKRIRLSYDKIKSLWNIKVLAVYGPTIKELIVEEFGDGIMSAIDFNLTVAREKNEQGDRVSLVLSGKFLPYKDF